MSKTLLYNCSIVTCVPAAPFIAEGALLLEENIIAEVGEYRDIRQRHPEARLMNMHGGYIVPGRINAHTHLYSSFALGMPSYRTFADFYDVLENKWWQLDRALTEEDCYYSALSGLLRSIQHGTTTIVDHHSSPQAIDGILDTLERAVSSTGVRASLCYEVSDRDGDDSARLGLEENRRFLERLKREKPARLHGLLGMHASFTLSDRTLEWCAQAGQDLQVGFHVHLNEAAIDDEKSLEHYGSRAIDRFSRFGILNRESITAHAVHVPHTSMDLLAESGVTVVHNPQSNMNNAVGPCPLDALNVAGVFLCLGTDAMTTDMMEEARMVPLLQSHAGWKPGHGFDLAARMVIDNNANLASRLFGGKFGRIATGYAADFCVIRYQPVTPVTEENYAAHLLWGLGRCAVDTVYIDGRTVYEAGSFVRIDAERIFARSEELAGELWKRL